MSGIDLYLFESCTHPKSSKNSIIVLGLEPVVHCVDCKVTMEGQVCQNTPENICEKVMGYSAYIL